MRKGTDGQICEKVGQIDRRGKETGGRICKTGGQVGRKMGKWMLGM